MFIFSEETHIKNDLGMLFSYLDIKEQNTLQGSKTKSFEKCITNNGIFNETVLLTNALGVTYFIKRIDLDFITTCVVNVGRPNIKYLNISYESGVTLDGKDGYRLTVTIKY